MTSRLNSVPGNSARSDGEGEDECEGGSHEEDADAGRGGRVQVQGHRHQDAEEKRKGIRLQVKSICYNLGLTISWYFLLTET